MSWYKIRFSFDEDPLTPAQLIAQEAAQIDEQAGYLDGFAVFAGIRPGQENADTYHELYFTPTASAACHGLLTRYGATKCEPPIASELVNFGPIYGNASRDLKPSEGA